MFLADRSAEPKERRNSYCRRFQSGDAGTSEKLVEKPVEREPLPVGTAYPIGLQERRDPFLAQVVFDTAASQCEIAIAIRYTDAGAVHQA